MINLGRTMTVSFFCHLALFGMFSLSFGPKAPLLRPPNVAFLGEVISGAEDLLKAPRHSNVSALDLAFNRADNVMALKGLDRAGYVAIKDFSKPQAEFVYPGQKVTFLLKPSYDAPVLQSKPVIMFYPQLPYHFMLYFKDRQIAHIELMFNIAQGEKRNSIMLKRRISSGNLEADLLCSRYISRYLSIQQMGFSWNNWQSVKIDLSPKNDQP